MKDILGTDKSVPLTMNDIFGTAKAVPLTNPISAKTEMHA
jgi:hypothetical protein